MKFKNYAEFTPCSSFIIDDKQRTYIFYTAYSNYIRTTMYLLYPMFIYIIYINYYIYIINIYRIIYNPWAWVIVWVWCVRCNPNRCYDTMTHIRKRLPQSIYLVYYTTVEGDNYRSYITIYQSIHYCGQHNYIIEVWDLSVFRQPVRYNS